MTSAGRASALALIGLGVLLTTLWAGAQPSQTATLAHYGEWALTEELDSEGRIYRATLHDHNDNNRYLQFKCWPSKRDYLLWLADEAIKNHEPRNFLVTFNNSRLRAIDQFNAAGNEGHVDLQSLFLELVGCVGCNPAFEPHDGPLYLAVENREMEFNPAGARDAFDQLARRCHLR